MSFWAYSGLPGLPSIGNISKTAIIRVERRKMSFASGMENVRDGVVEKLRSLRGLAQMSPIVRRLLASAEMSQARQFGWDDNMVTDSSAEKTKLYRIDVGLQAVVEFNGTAYLKSYDKAVDALRRYARSGRENMGWKNRRDEQNPQDDLDKWGQKRPVKVNGREYDVIEETTADANHPSVSIMGAYDLATDTLISPETGSYYFSGVATYKELGEVGERKLDICGAHMPLDEVRSDITEIINIASNTKV